MAQSDVRCRVSITDVLEFDDLVFPVGDEDEVWLQGWSTHKNSELSEVYRYVPLFYQDYICFLTCKLGSLTPCSSFKK